MKILDPPLISTSIMSVDSNIYVRLSARISHLSPQILTELEHSGVGRNKEQSARMLAHLVSNAPRLIRPYMEPILKVINMMMVTITIVLKMMMMLVVNPN